MRASRWEPLFSGPEIFVTLQAAKATALPPPPRISLYLPVSPRICPYLPLSARISRISPYLERISPDLAKVAGFCYALEEQLEAAGIDVRTMNPEYGDGQLEITVSPSWGVSAADDASTFKTAVKEVAMQFGATATFMTKPFSLSGPGNGGHFNFSLWEPEGAEAASGALGREGAERGPCHVGKGDERGGGGGFCSEGLRNALHDASAPAGLSPPPQQRLAGRLPEGLSRGG